MIYLLAFNFSSIILWFSNLFKSKLFRKVLVAVSAIILIILVGTRYNVGTDYISYKYIYQTISALKWDELMSFTETEIGHTLLCKILSYLGYGYKSMFLIYGFLTTFFLYKSMKKLNVNKYFFILAYVCLIFPYSFNIMRQVLSMAIVLYSMTFLFNNEKMKSFIYLFIAFLFHKPAIIVLPIYLCHLFIDSKKTRNFLLVSTYLFIIALFMSNTLTLNNIDALTRYTNYIQSDGIDYTIMITNIIKKLPIILLMFVFRNDFKDENHNNYTYISLFIIGLILSFLGGISSTLSRLSLYFTIFDIVLIGKFMNRRNIPTIKIMIYIYLFAYFIYQFYYSGIGELFPYNSWLV